MIPTNQNGDGLEVDINLPDYTNAERTEPISLRTVAPFSTDPEAIEELDKCEYFKINPDVAAAGMANRKVRVYSDGIYDVFHQGHAKQLQQAKTAFPNAYLIVGVCNDALTYRRKGRTVMNEEERYEAVRHCKYVDEVIRDAPWEIDETYLQEHKIDFVAHDDIPYTSNNQNDIYAFLKENNMFVITKRTEGVSTSDIVARIVRNYDMYVRTNLAHGYSAKELNVSFLNEKKFRFQNMMDDWKDKGKKVMTNIVEKKVDFFAKWEEKSRDLIESFLLIFGNRGSASNVWNESKENQRQVLSIPPSTDNAPPSDLSEGSIRNNDFQSTSSPISTFKGFDGGESKNLLNEVTNSDEEYLDSNP